MFSTATTVLEFAEAIHRNDTRAMSRLATTLDKWSQVCELETMYHGCVIFTREELMNAIDDHSDWDGTGICY